jgi:hypothetical protein
MGVESHTVIWTQHNHAATQLCIDAMKVLYTHSVIRTFVLVVGDRSYIPVIQHIRTQTRSVKTVAFKCNLSSDLLQNIGEARFIDAQHLLRNRAAAFRLQRSPNSGDAEIYLR